MRSKTFRDRTVKAAFGGPLLIFDRENMRYLTGSDAGAALVVPVEREPVLLASRMEAERASSQTWIDDVRQFNKGEVSLRRNEEVISDSLGGAIRKVAQELEIGEISFDRIPEEVRDDLDHLELSRTDRLRDMRMIKSDLEIRRIKKARGIAGAVYDEVSSEIEEGETELELAGRIYRAIMSRGSIAAFEPIVAFDKNSAFPHHSPTTTELGSSAIVLIDLGARVDGYCSDITRTMLTFPGPAEESLEKVRSAINAAVDGMEPGMELTKVAEAAREALGKESSYFIHSLGHGLGLGVHEPPVISTNSDEKLKEGMVFTIEPGIYYKGRFGVRWEEDVVCRQGGVEIL